MDKLAIQAEGLGVTIGASPILHDISFSVDEGESVALVGQNGSGKSTLLRALVGIIPPSSGSIEIYGENTHAHPEVLSHVGYVPQRFARASGVPATAYEVVRTGLLSAKKLRAHRGAKARAATMEALEAVGLAERAHDHVQVFSGGQMQRVMIARALVRKPGLLLLDEPLSGIDRQSRESLFEILSGLRGSGVTLLTVLHEMGELAPLIERTIELDEGRIVYDGAPRDHDTCHRHDDHHEDIDLTRPAHHAPRMQRRFP
ncbi:MAG: metal ABC transporter ATP-binding protein [Actinomycetaceae bacterium]|nr:metal ABC transporter ATP-binding protein [Actinomycetaceae bacterium]